MDMVIPLPAAQAKYTIQREEPELLWGSQIQTSLTICFRIGASIKHRNIQVIEKGGS